MCTVLLLYFDTKANELSPTAVEFLSEHTSHRASLSLTKTLQKCAVGEARQAKGDAKKEVNK